MNDDCPVTDEQRRLFHEFIDLYFQMEAMPLHAEAFVAVANRFSWLEDKLALVEAAEKRSREVLQRAYTFFFTTGEDSYELLREAIWNALRDFE